MLFEIAAALAALSVGASLGVYVVASEGASFSYRMPRVPWMQWLTAGEAKAPARARSKVPSVEVVSDNLLWRFTEQERALREGIRVEPFCAVCDEPLGVVDERVLFCGPCGLRSPLPGDLKLCDAQVRAEAALRKAASASVLP